MQEKKQDKDTLKYIDTHSHIHFKDFDNDRVDVSNRMSVKRVGTIAIGTDLKTSLQVVELANTQTDIWACIGVHPDTHESFHLINTRVNSGEIGMSKVVAVGECGIDYFRTEADELASEQQRQQALFLEHVNFATEHSLPLMLHIRSSADSEGKSTDDAHNHALTILAAYKEGHGTLPSVHCHFTTFGIEMAQRFIDLDEHVTFGIPGVVTYKSAPELQELVQWLPLEKLLSETDAPYAAPVPHRGKRNEPTFVVDIVNAIADLRGEDREMVREQLLENAKRVFNLEIQCPSQDELI